MKQKTIVGVAILAIVAMSGLAIYSYRSPSIWLEDLKKAAQEGDKDRLRDLVDFDSVKTGLKEDIKTQFVALMGAELKDNPFAALGMAMASMMVDPMVETIVSPSGIAALMEKGRVEPPPSNGTANTAPSSTDAKSSYDGITIERGYDNFSRYRIRIRQTNMQTQEPIILTLKREGLFGWNLTRISLPSNLLNGTGNNELPQRSRKISIEASDMQALDPAHTGQIALTATLRNQATIALGYPALDVVLTDIKDHTVARRIFLPAEYLDTGKDPRAGIPANAEITVRLNLDSGDLGATGFRLDLINSDWKGMKELQINPEKVELLKPGTLSVELMDKRTGMRTQTSLVCLEWGSFAAQDVLRAAIALSRFDLGDNLSRTEETAADSSQRTIFVIRDPGDAIATKIAKLRPEFPSATLKAKACAGSR